MLQHIEFIPLVVSFLVGIVFITWRKPDADQKIPKYPHPSNVGTIVYRDRTGLCYKYKANEVPCPSVKQKLKPFPYQ